MNENTTPYDNTFAIQFNGWNFGAINDWVYGERGIYHADFKEEFELGSKVVHRNDWVVKEEDGAFNIMSNYDFQERMDKQK